MKRFQCQLFICLFLVLSSVGRAGPRKTLKVLAFKDNHTNGVKKNLATFERLTGSKVIFDMIASHMVATKTLTDQLAGGSYDIYAVDEPFVPKLAPYLLPLKKWPKVQMIPGNELSLTQYVAAAQRAAAYGGISYGLPVNGNVYVYIYRKDLLQDPQERENFKKRFHYDLKPPRTFKEMENIAEYFYRPPKMYGFAPFTKKSEGAMVEVLWLFASFGIELFAADGTLIFDHKRAKQALDFYSRMLAYAPRGARSWHHSERMSTYSKGKIVQMMTWPSFLPGLEDPLRSLVVGKTAYGISPAHGDLDRANTMAGVWLASIAKTSKNKALASEFIAWWASYKFGKKMVFSGMNPARYDLLLDPELRQKQPFFPAVLENFSLAKIRPRWIHYKRWSDQISSHFTSFIVGTLSSLEAAIKIKKSLEDSLEPSAI